MTAQEQHYRVKELAVLWGFSAATIRRLFRDETGVPKIGKPRSRRGPIKLPHIQLSIPASVAERVYKRITGEAAA